MAARRHRRTSHHRPARITSDAAPWWLPEETCFDLEQSPTSSGSRLSTGSASHAGSAANAGSPGSGSRVRELRDLAHAISTRGEGWMAPTSERAFRCMAEIHALVEAGRYDFGAHVQSHMIEEGFDKEHCVGAVLGGRVLEVYAPPQKRREHQRFLVAGRFHLSARNTCPLHVVCEMFQAPAPRQRPNTHTITMEERVRFVTAYIPRRPEWISPHVRASRA